MIENIIVFLLVAILIKTSGRRNYLGFLVLGYYAIFILIDIDYYGINQLDLVFTSNMISWSMFMIFTSILFSILSAVLYFKGSRIAGLYSGWLIINAIVIFIEALDTNNAMIVELIYNAIQNINLFMDLLVVILGTDNILHRTKGIESSISSVNSLINSIGNRNTDNRYKA